MINILGFGRIHFLRSRSLRLTHAILKMIPVTFRSLLLLVLIGVACIPAAHGQGDPSDLIFSAVPFDRWLTEGEQASFRWSVRVGGSELSSHQRLQTRVEVRIAGNELVNRRGHGQLVIMLQFQDGAERVYRTLEVLDLRNVSEDAGKSNIQYLQDAFVLPGDYRVGVAMFDAKTKEHSAVQKLLHVNALRNDPLPDAWKDLPSVEFLHAREAPDSWFLPYLTGGLRLPLTTRHPIHLDVLMNASPSGPSRGLSAGTVNNRSLANMVPALKVFSQIELAGGSLHITLLDIPNRHAIFDQDVSGRLDWARLREGLTEADPNKIDIRSLEHREQNAQYFEEQVRRRLAAEGGATQLADEPIRVLIVLTAPMTLDSGEKPHPMEPVGKINGKVYYFRCHLPLEHPVTPLFDPLSRTGRRGNPAAVSAGAR